MNSTAIVATVVLCCGSVQAAGTVDKTTLTRKNHHTCARSHFLLGTGSSPQNTLCTNSRGRARPTIPSSKATFWLRSSKCGDLCGLKLIIIGIDGADLEVMRPLLSSGALPRLAALAQDGVMAPLNSHPPTRSPAVWTTLATGVRKESHGIYDYVTNSYYWPDELRTKKKNRTTSAMRRVPALWSLMSQEKRSSVVVGWLSTWPAEDIQGAMVAPYIHIGNTRQTTIKGSIYRTNAPQQTFSPRLFAELQPLLKEPSDFDVKSRLQYYDELPADSPIYAKIPILKRYNYTASWSSARMHNVTHSTTYLVNKLKPELAMVYYQCPDSFGHRFWHFRLSETELAERLGLLGLEPELAAEMKQRYGQAIDNCYRAVDAEIGKLLDNFGNGASVMVVSDHGFGSSSVAKVNRSVPFDGGHREQGTIILSGPAFRSDATLNEPWCEDVAPTAMRVLGLKTPAYVEGRVLDEAIREGASTQAAASQPASMP